MVSINEAITKLLGNMKPIDLANDLEVSTAMISIWKNKENDFVPRLPVAAKIYQKFDIVVYPYDVIALQNYGT